MIKKHSVYLSLGSNIGDREGNILRAYEMLECMVGHIIRKSSMLQTEPWGFDSDNLFVNSAVCIETEKTPREVLALTQQIERELGRTRKSVNGEYHDRTIDIDILLYDDICMDEPDLKIPHPLMNERDFVMIPLNEIRQSAD